MQHHLFDGKVVVVEVVVDVVVVEVVVDVVVVEVEVVVVVVPAQYDWQSDCDVVKHAFLEAQHQP
jgi:hypothetical protein